PKAWECLGISMQLFLEFCLIFSDNVGIFLIFLFLDFFNFFIFESYV
uniref:Uncharacterized protein n=1 Tax=Amphimedon queenslandica TaxID=400682 RepID=A0A1X7T5U5_AMPQE